MAKIIKPIFSDDFELIRSFRDWVDESIKEGNWEVTVTMKSFQGSDSVMAACLNYAALREVSVLIENRPSPEYGEHGEVVDLIPQEAAQ